MYIRYLKHDSLTYTRSITTAQAYAATMPQYLLRLRMWYSAHYLRTRTSFAAASSV